MRNIFDHYSNIHRNPKGYKNFFNIMIKMIAKSLRPFKCLCT